MLLIRRSVLVDIVETVGSRIVGDEEVLAWYEMLSCLWSYIVSNTMMMVVPVTHAAKDKRSPTDIYRSSGHVNNRITVHAYRMKCVKIQIHPKETVRISFGVLCSRSLMAPTAIIMLTVITYLEEKLYDPPFSFILFVCS